MTKLLDKTVLAHGGERWREATSISATERRMYVRDDQGHALPEPLIVSIRIDDIEVAK